MFIKKQNGFIGVLILIVLLIVGIILVGASVSKRQKTTDSPKTSSPVADAKLIGFSLSPKPGNAGFTDFFAFLPKHDAAVTWAGDWEELGSASAAPHVVAGLADQYNYTPIIIVHTHTDAGNFNQVKLIRPLSSATQQNYMSLAADFCKKYKPKYFGIGVEINRIYASSQSEFNQFVDLFNDTANSIHSNCPDTKVFTTFQLEHLRGLRGGLYGGTNNEQVNDWQLLDKFSSADVVAFTTYPGIIYKDPADIPSDYYSSITAKTDKPIAFSEIGWPGKLSVKGWESSEDEQHRFVQRFKDLTSDVDSPFKVWSFLYDQNLTDPFDDMGLVRSDNTPRPGYDSWISN